MQLIKKTEDTIKFTVFNDEELTQNMTPSQKVDLMNRALSSV